MNWLLIYTLLAVSLWLIVVGLSRPGGTYQFPFVAGATFLFFVMPQLPALANDGFLPADALSKTTVFCILSAAMCGLGWAAGRRPMGGLDWTFDERRLLGVAALLSLIGAFFFYKISALPKEMTSASQWSGLPVAYLFFAELLGFGLAIAVLLFVRRPSLPALALCLFGASFYVDRILGSGRRAVAAELLVLIALALWFQRRMAVPRAIFIAAIFAVMLAIPSTGDYRAISKGGLPAWSDVVKIDVWGNFTELLERGGLEMRNALQRIHFVDETQDFDYGAYHWNVLVFNFVPAQIFGADFKQSLMIPTGARQFNPNYESQLVLGTTHTGMADAFASFWYFGALKFFVIAYILGRIYQAAMVGNTAYQLVYIVSLTPAAHVITHETQWIISTWVYMLVLFVPFLALGKASGRRPEAAPQPQAGAAWAPSGALPLPSGLRWQ